MDLTYVLVDSNGGTPALTQDWKKADWLIFNAASMEDFGEAWRIGKEDDEHKNSKRALRCLAEIRSRYPNAVPGYHPYKDSDTKQGSGTRVAAVRQPDGYYELIDLDGIQSYQKMGNSQTVWHVWVDFFLRGDPVAIWIAHARNLGKYFVENMQLPIEDAEAQRNEHIGEAVVRNVRFKAQKAIESNGTNGEHANPAEGKIILKDYKTGEPINIGALKACDVRIYPTPNWSRVVQWNPKDVFVVQEFLQYREAQFPCTVI